MILVRKYAPAKWKPSQALPQGVIPADAVTVDLQTSGNTLSFWKCRSAENDELDEPALAIAAAKQHIETFDLFWIPQSTLSEEGLTLQATPGKTPVKDLRNRHVDIASLDYGQLGKVARHVATAIKDQRCRRITQKEAKDLLMAALHKRRVKLDDLDKYVRNKLQR